MRLPTDIECLYLDFDGFFASVEQALDPRLRGRPVGVVPFAGSARTCIIACSREAKRLGVKNIMGVADARRLCPDIILVPQQPDMYRRAHNALLAEIETVIPITAVKSIDELTCDMDARARRDPEALAAAIKAAIRDGIGRGITCSIGMAANRQLAKIAGKQNKPDGLTIWHPRMMPEPLLAVPLDDIPGVGGRMVRRLAWAGVADTAGLYAMAPKHMRQVWGNVTGERLWYALHGYAVHAPDTQRGMFGHSRVMPPEARGLAPVYRMARLLATRAARRMRREGWFTSMLHVGLDIEGGGWWRAAPLPMVGDDLAILRALRRVWDEAMASLPPRTRVFRVNITLGDLTPAGQRQTDLFRVGDDRLRQRAEAATRAMDALNARYGRTVVSVGPWTPREGDYAGGKIAFTRIPSAEDFQ